MFCAVRLAERLGRVEAAMTARIRSLLETFGLPVEVPSLDRQPILDSLMHDKKVHTATSPSSCQAAWATWNWSAISQRTISCTF